MACRHSEICKCEQSIQKLEQAGKDLGELFEEDYRIIKAQENLMYTSVDCFTSEKFEQLNLTIQNLNQDGRMAIIALLEQVYEELERLEQKLNDFMEEDAEYHASEDRE